MRRRLPWLFLLVLLATPALAAASPVTTVWVYTVELTSPPDPGPGWGDVSQLLTSSGCSGTTCGASWTPDNGDYEVLLENASHRVTLAHAEGDGRPPNTGSVIYPRDRCPTDEQWAAGTWHHNFYAESTVVETSRESVVVQEETSVTQYSYVTLTQQWRSAYYQSFAHNDGCFAPGAPLPSPTPRPTSPPTPTPTSPPPGSGGATPVPPGPAPAPVAVTVVVQVEGEPLTPGTATGTGSGSYAVGSAVRATAQYPTSWDQDSSWNGIRYAGCGVSGSSWEATFAAPAEACTLTFTIRFTSVGPAPTMHPTLTPIPTCFQEQGLPEAMPLTVAPGTVSVWTGPLTTDVNVPPRLPDTYTVGQVSSGTLTLTFHPEQTGVQGQSGPSIFGAWHSAAAKFNIRLLDLGTDPASASDDQTLLWLDTVEALRPMADDAPTDDRGQHLTAWQLAPGVTASGPMTWHAYTTDAAGGWYEQVYWMNNPATTGQPDRRWPAVLPDLPVERWWVREPAPVRFSFIPTAGHQYQVAVETLKKSCGTWFSIWTVAQFQSGYQVPAPTVTVWGQARPDGSAPWVSTAGNDDPLRFTWPYGDVLSFYPDAALSFDLDAALVAAGYRVDWQIDGWTFLGSPPHGQAALERAHRQPVAVLWSKYPPPDARPPDLYAYAIPAVTDQQLAVHLRYSYQIVDAAGVPLSEPVTASTDTAFTVALLAPQVQQAGGVP